MKTIERTHLWADTLGARPDDDPEAEKREELRSAFKRFREQASTVAGETAKSFRFLTVHDATHCDALWEIADVIAGHDYQLTPVEAFVLGGAFLLHDLGLALASYPGGLAELKSSEHWRETVAVCLRREFGRNATPEEIDRPPAHIEEAATEQVLRDRHAAHAESLGEIKFRNDDTGAECFLIEQLNLRSHYGRLIGRIAHSHWWQVSNLRAEFEHVQGPAPGYPPQWTVDPLKIACLLRAADACHLDERRAPLFLEMLRKPVGVSRWHWRFQSRMQMPVLVDDKLVFASSSPFPAKDAEAWWLCHDTLKMANDELHKVDSLLQETKRNRFAAHRIAGIDDISDLSRLVKTDGWFPVDTRVHVNDVVSLVKKLGGNQLYGGDLSVPLRELIQNSADAVRARRIKERKASDWGQVFVRLGSDAEGPWLEVADNGVGMSQSVLTGPLLDFGASYWESPLAAREHPGLYSKGFEPTGQYGIGFFSTFMWGPHVRVITRRQEDGIHESRVLEFLNGLDAMPILRSSLVHEQLSDPGTTVRVWFTEPAYKIFCASCVNRTSKFAHSCGLGVQQMDVTFSQFCAWLCPALDVDLSVDTDGGPVRSVKANDWKDIPGLELIMRTMPQPVAAFADWPDDGMRTLGECVRPIQQLNGELVGRGCLAIASELKSTTYHWLKTHLHGTITAGPFRSRESTIFAGLLIGRSKRAIRDQAAPLASPEIIAQWSSEQANLIADLGLPERQLLRASQALRSVGGDTGPLPIAHRHDEFFTREEIQTRADTTSTFILINSTDWAHLSKERPNLSLNSGILIVDSGPLGNMREMSREDYRDRCAGLYPEFRWNTLFGAVAEAIAAGWNTDLEALLKNAIISKPQAPIVRPIGTDGGEELKSSVLAIFSREQIASGDSV
jgi:hypothetical protein